LIEALPQIRASVPGAALVIVGDGPYRGTLEKKVHELHLENDVHFAGKVDYEMLPAWYLTGDVFAMPCRTRNAGWDVEGLGIVYLEASACGLPVVAGNSGGAPDAVLNHQTGVVVDGRNHTDIATTIGQLLNDKQLSHQLGQAGRAWVEQKWTWTHSFNILQSLLQ
jgi:phosphatidylinositol alpha-1,6-mannosyltransferase